MLIAHNEKDRDLKLDNEPKMREELKAAEKPFWDLLEQMFGIKNARKNWREDAYSHDPLPIVDKALITQLVKTAHQCLLSQRDIAQHYGKMDLYIGSEVTRGKSLVTVDELERALEFLDENSPRRTPDSLLSVINAILYQVNEDKEVLSPMNEPKPSILYPRGVATYPLSGIGDRIEWENERQYYLTATYERAQEVRNFVQSNVENWGENKPRSFSQVEQRREKSKPKY